MKVIEPLGRRFFWVKSTGNIVAQRGEMAAGIESTKEEDFAVYVELKPYDPDAIEMTTFEPGQYSEEFATASSWRFNPDTGEIEFAYPDPNAPTDPPVYQSPLTQQVAELKSETAALNLAIIDVWETLAAGGGA
ncbi:hypothetical protein [Paenibacillus campinasensis]|uniref:Uncharacterized protein n=1 Tax=Paenibacillus campinasensis TaxID=66347 RepID=A0A268EGY6_9BACL|nr:hypothetical protein [Paenibacillus campinasensis]PAD72382.1 hypothetical protein CHH67_22320 [Paenibacillus campinasensis]